MRVIFYILGKSLARSNEASYWTKRRKISAEVQCRVENLQDVECSESVRQIAPILPSIDNVTIATANDVAVGSLFVTEHDTVNSSGRSTFTSESSMAPLLGDTARQVDLNDHSISANSSITENSSDCNNYDIVLDMDSDCNSMSDSDDDAKSEDENIDDFQDRLSQWAIDSNVTTKDLRSLLEILRSKHSYLPKDPRTMRHTNANKSKNSIRNICDGHYCHFGIQEGY